MKYPAFIKEGSTIGICAPSFGVPFDPYRAKYEEGKRKLIEHGFKIKESTSVYNLEKAQSNTPQIRAKEFMDLYLDEEVDLIMSVAGGEIMCEILPFIDFDKIKNSKPKYFMGYSDNTNLTFTLTTICDLVSIYGACVTNYGTYDLDKSLIESIEMISGNLFKQESYEMYEVESLKDIDPLSNINLEKQVEWRNLKNEKSMEFSGRFLGGCLDVLISLVGTKYDLVKEYIERFLNEWEGNV